jgi:hypothetical protein
MDKIAKQEDSSLLSGLSHRPRLCTQGQESRSKSELILLQGTKRDDFVGPTETTELYSAGPLEIQIEGAEESANLIYNIGWLDNGEARNALEKCPSLFVDAECLAEEITLCQNNIMYITAKGTVLKVSWRCESDQCGDKDIWRTSTSRARKSRV